VIKRSICGFRSVRSRKPEGSFGRNSDGGIFAHSKLGKYLESHPDIPEDK